MIQIQNSKRFGFRISDFGFSQSGQTLIETVVALFILTTGLSAGLALAIYSFSTSTTISKKVVATGLAREGIEAVRRMRDSNWLSGTLTDCGGGELCYTTWLTGPYNISGAGGAGTEYRMLFDPVASGNKWTLSGGADFRLYRIPGLGYGTSVSQPAIPSFYFRKIHMVNVDSGSPYTAASPLMLVRSTVWWWDKNCPEESSNPANTTCKVVTEEYLTNWKNY